MSAERQTTMYGAGDFRGLVSVFHEDVMAGVLPATSGDGTPETPGPTEQSCRDRGGYIGAGYFATLVALRLLSA
jgi:hypothetical protein